eukprot:Phypoly_transcript_22727.p1 GENE.Phypoly_transcript_22727~~Phypoly_transcript_22727.p1  ORF type:complete len:174 (+),score=39.43 Phypoly_transcript_22727:61-522(+)
MSSSESEKKESKKRKRVDDDPSMLAPIATPLADRKLTKRLLKLVKQSIEAKELKRGVKQCVKFIRKEEPTTKNRLAILGGDVSPIDVVAHIPVMCEDRDIPYIYIASRQQLGQAAGTKRPTSIVLVTLTDNSSNKKLFKKCKETVQEVQPIKT